MNKILLFLIISFSVFGAKITDDSLILGSPGSTSDKSLVFRSSVGNVNLKIDYTTGSFIFESSKLVIGDGTSSNTTFESNIGLGANNPKIVFDVSKNRYRQEIDGSLKDIGSGSGSGSGGGINGFGADDNPNAEDGTTGWTTSGSGSFSIDSIDPLEGENSFTYTASAQNDYVESNVLNFDRDIFKQRSCQAEITYIGGDENLEIHVVDGNGDILNPLYLDPNTGERRNRALKSHTITAPESVSFICPSALDIAGDANKGQLKLRLVNFGATAAPLIKWDLTYMGTLKGLFETTLPDSISINVQPDGSSNNSNLVFVSWASGIAGQELGYRFDISAFGFTEIPNVQVTGGRTTTYTQLARDVNWRATNPQTLYVSIGNGSVFIQEGFSLTLTKQGADAKQSVQVYKSIPKVSENINEFSANIDLDGSILSQNTNWINGSCSQDSTGLYTCPYISSLSSIKMSCIADIDGNFFGSTQSANTFDSIAGQVKVMTLAAGSRSYRPFNIKCTKQDSDFKLPTVQPIFVGGAYNSYYQSIGKTMRIETCKTTGAPLFDSDSCTSWISSVVNQANGQRRYNLIENNDWIDVCFHSSREGSYAGGISANIDHILTRQREESGNSFSQTDEQISCMGVY